MKRLAFAPAFAALVLAAPLAHAEGMAQHDPEWDVGLKASTLGVGLEVRRSFGPELAARGVFNTFTYDLEEEIDDVEYDGDLELSSGGLLVDWHPAGNGFRITAGVLINGTELDVDAQPSGGTFEFDGQTYTAAEVGTAEGTAEFATFSPYLGVGWGRAFGDGGRFAISLDAGVLFQGEPDFDLEVTCGAAVPALRCTQLQADVAEERDQFEDDAQGLAYFPVLSLGLSYRVGGN